MPFEVPMHIDIGDDLTAEETALALLARGHWPVVIDHWGKNRVGQHVYLPRPTEEWLRDVYRLNPALGVGLQIGPEAGIIDIDIDGPAAAPWLDRLFPDGVPRTAGFQSRRGPHWLFRFDERLAPYGVRVHNHEMEIRIGMTGDCGPPTHVAIPPTPPAHGAEPRRWLRTGEILPLPDEFFGRLESIVAEWRRPT
jgi:hypothetical protein